MASALVIEATVGAAFGGLATPIVNALIAALKITLRCRGECRELGEVLERIQPKLKEILSCYRNDPAGVKWLVAFEKCVKDADRVRVKCQEPNRILRYARTVFNGGKILKIHDSINQLLVEAPLLLHKSKWSSCGITQDVPERIFGMDGYLERVNSAVCEGLNSNGRSCVGIRGMGGVGKTLLAQKVKNDEKLQDVFGKDFVIWITVGRDGNVSEIYKRMRKQLKMSSDGGSLEDQRMDLMNAFANAKALLILDDVWDFCVYGSKKMVYWLNIAKGAQCVTVVTTRDEAVTRECVNAGEVYLGQLSEEESWQLFCIHAFGTDTPELDANVEDMARVVCKECKCLPLALRVIGCAMKGESDWRRMVHHMQAPGMLSQSIEEELYGRLKVSYDDLDGPTKTCFLYFAAFPEDCDVKVKVLCQIWKVEGLFGEELSEEEVVDEAYCALRKLVQRSLIEVCKVNDDGTVEEVKMHDVLRDLAMSLVRKGRECERECLFKMVKDKLVEFPSAWLGCEMKVKRLSIWGGTYKRFPDDVSAPNLEICMLQGDWRAGRDHDCVIGHEFFGWLLALKFLQICGYGNIKQIQRVWEN